jgi:hypothetical protein
MVIHVELCSKRSATTFGECDRGLQRKRGAVGEESRKLVRYESLA